MASFILPSYLAWEMAEIGMGVVLWWNFGERGDGGGRGWCVVNGGSG